MSFFHSLRDDNQKCYLAKTRSQCEQLNRKKTTSGFLVILIFFSFIIDEACADSNSLNQNIVYIAPQYFSLGPISCNISSPQTQMIKESLEKFLLHPLDTRLKDHTISMLELEVNKTPSIDQVKSGARVRSPYIRRNLMSNNMQEHKSSPLDKEEMLEFEVKGWAHFNSDPLSSDLLNAEIDALFEDHYQDLLNLIRDEELILVDENSRCFSSIFQESEDPQRDLGFLLLRLGLAIIFIAGIYLEVKTQTYVPSQLGENIQGIPPKTVIVERSL